jgi:hypothetical protein
MYSGTTLHGKSGNLIGAHQKFDRVARRFVDTLRPGTNFPNSKLILHFEGNNGPDAIKRKSPGIDEPWHLWDPTDDNDQQLLDVVREHQVGLVRELGDENFEKAAFEAAWLAHAIVDGLTPPHHYPYEEKLLALRGEGLETRNSIRNKIIIQGDTKRQTLSRNWKMWGAKGLMLSHASFEWGVSTVVIPMRLSKGLPTAGDIKHARNIGFDKYLRENALAIYELNMYERFLRHGWTTKLGKEIRQNLGPKIANCITVAWVLAIDEAGK